MTLKAMPVDVLVAPKSRLDANIERYRYLDDMISVGRLTVAIGNEQPFSVGAIPIDLPRLDIAIRVKDRWTANLIALDPEYQLGQAWMDGALTIEQGALDGFMDLIGRNMSRKPWPGPLAWSREWLARALTRTNSPGRSRRNVAHHYDLSEGFYRLFLDADLQYSCAYFSDPGMTLEEAQTAKKSAYRSEARSAARLADTRHWVRVGRDGLVARANGGRACDRHHAFGRTAPRGA
ncbi:class I SAM-dependent methyltransferase (plasmid) [Novosphingobium sp. BL-8A]|uniref:class I SAM-dependent methyltransferase n=1 Tax=Novosphingobium sp. BL-8A TaxID=3127639 RepID=UPI003756A1A3